MNALAKGAVAEIPEGLRSRGLGGKIISSRLSQEFLWSATFDLLYIFFTEIMNGRGTCFDLLILTSSFPALFAKMRKTIFQKEKKTMKKFLALILLLTTLVMSFALTSCGGNPGEKDLENVKAAGKIVVGMECAYAPYNWTETTKTATNVPIANSQGAYADGYDVQIAKAVAEALDVNLEIQAIEWNGLVPALEAGKIDMIVAGMSPTEDRKLSIDFSDIYFPSTLVMVVRKDGNYTNATKISDFSGAKITAQTNTFHYDVIDQISGVNKQTSKEDFAGLITELNAGTVDGYVCEKPGAMSAVAANPDFTYVEFSEGNGFDCDISESSIAVGVRKGSTLTAEINKVIASLSESDMTDLMNWAILVQPVVDDTEE